MDSGKISIKMENGKSADVVVLSKKVHAIEIVLGEGVHSVRCELTPTRNESAYVGTVMGREIIYERSKADVQADIDRLDPNLRRSRPR